MPVIESGQYAPPTSRAIYFGNNVAITSSAALTWNTLHSGTALLDISTPSGPTVVAAGVYAFSVEVSNVGDMTSGGFFTVTLELDTAGDDATIDANSPVATAATHNMFVPVCMTYFCPAGAGVTLTVQNKDGVAQRTFTMTGTVQRIS